MNTLPCLHIEVIADYGRSHTTDHAFNEVYNHFLRYDKNNQISHIKEHPVAAFSTIETGLIVSYPINSPTFQV